MKKFVIAAALAGVSLAGCATNPNQYGYDPYYQQGPGDADQAAGEPRAYLKKAFSPQSTQRAQRFLEMTNSLSRKR